MVLWCSLWLPFGCRFNALQCIKSRLHHLNELAIFSVCVTHNLWMFIHLWNTEIHTERHIFWHVLYCVWFFVWLPLMMHMDKDDVKLPGKPGGPIKPGGPMSPRSPLSPGGPYSKRFFLRKSLNSCVLFVQNIILCELPDIQANLVDLLWRDKKKKKHNI